MMARDWKVNPAQEKYVSPIDVAATPMQMRDTMYSSITEVFSRPEKNENINTATGVNAFNI
jgi:hypothetical protein